MPTHDTLFEKVWTDHVIAEIEDGNDLLHIDRHVLHDMTSFKAFDDLRESHRTVHSPNLTLAVQDHVLATDPGRDENTYAQGTPFLQAQRRNAREYGVPLVDVHDAEQGIVHVVAPELGYTLPGTTVVCGDSHTCTNGGLGAVAFGIGSSDVGHVLATQTLVMKRPKTLRLLAEGSLGPGVYAKDLILHTIAQAGCNGGSGYAVEYAGTAVEALPVEARLTLCNMSIEWGARIGMVAPDDATYEYIAGRRCAPQGEAWERAVAYWRTLPTQDGARFDRELSVDAGRIAPQVTWGTSPEHALGIDEAVPDPSREADPSRRAVLERALAYMGLEPGMRMNGLAIKNVFIGSCTNARLSDLREAAKIARGRKVAVGVRAMVVPGSSSVRREAEAEGLAEIFRQAGFEWHESACSMCAGVNADHVEPFARCAATSNRNFEGRQGRDARTHLVSPAMAAAAAVMGALTDVRRLMAT